MTCLKRVEPKVLRMLDYGDDPRDELYYAYDADRSHYQPSQVHASHANTFLFM